MIDRRGLRTLWRLLGLASAALQTAGCTGSHLVHEVGPTSLAFQSPSLSRAESFSAGEASVKLGFEKIGEGSLSGTTGNYESGGDQVKPRFSGNLSVQGSDNVLNASIAYRFSSREEIFAQFSGADIAGSLSSAWVFGYAREAQTNFVRPFFEGGFGLLDVYINTVKDTYKESEVLLIFPGSSDSISSEKINESRFLFFPHLGAGLKSDLGNATYLIGKLRAAYMPDYYDIGVNYYMYSFAIEADARICHRIYLALDAGFSINTLDSGNRATNFGLSIGY